MNGWHEVVIQLTGKASEAHKSERKPERESGLYRDPRQKVLDAAISKGVNLTWLVRADSPGEAMVAAAKQENYPEPHEVAQVIVRECHRYGNIVLNIPLTK